jgi:hypothetical protein
MNILLNKIGRIVEGNETGLLVKVEPLESGGYLILTWSDIENFQGCDDWVENLEMVKHWFEASHWKVLWLKDDEYMDIPINKTGCIIEGEASGLLIKIEPFRNDNKYRIRIRNWDENVSEFIDIWCNNLRELQKIFKLRNWKIHWLE